MSEQEEIEEAETEIEDAEPESTGVRGEPVGGVDVGDAPEEDVLAAAIEDNPEEVARLIRRAGLVNDLLDATEVATSAMTDSMVEELAGTSTNLLAAADAAATDEVVYLGEAAGENAEDLAEGLETLAELNRKGTLDELNQLADVLSLLTHAMDDEMVTRLTATGTQLGGLADKAADDDTVRGLERMLDAVGEADEADPERVGTIGLVRATRDPEVQAGLGYLIAVARAIGKGRSPK